MNICTRQLFVTLFTLLVFIEGQAASFDCGKASNNIERWICSNAELSKLDDDLAKVYSSAKNRSGNPDGLKEEQGAWLKTRNLCQAEKCVIDSYVLRIKQLDPSADQNAGATKKTETALNVSKPASTGNEINNPKPSSAVPPPALVERNTAPTAGASTEKQRQLNNATPPVGKDIYLGHGETVEKARTDAIRQALQAKLTQMTSSQIIVENDKIDERIFSTMHGHVEQFEQIKVSQVGGIVSYEARIIVSESTINNYLQSTGANSGKIQGESAFAEIKRKQENEKALSKMLSSYFFGFPTDVFSSSVTSMSVDGKDVVIGVRVWANAEWINSLDLFLTTVSKAYVPKTGLFEIIPADRRKGYSRNLNYYPEGMPGYFCLRNCFDIQVSDFDDSTVFSSVDYSIKGGWIMVTGVFFDKNGTILNTKCENPLDVPNLSFSIRFGFHQGSYDRLVENEFHAKYSVADFQKLGVDLSRVDKVLYIPFLSIPERGYVFRGKEGLTKEKDLCRRVLLEAKTAFAINK